LEEEHPAAEIPAKSSQSKKRSSARKSVVPLRVLEIQEEFGSPK
jgi:hypothetical protein